MNRDAEGESPWLVSQYLFGALRAPSGCEILIGAAVGLGRTGRVAGEANAPGSRRGEIRPSEG
jgi:hypothetical protein